MKFGLVLVGLVAAVGFVSLGVSGTADAGTMASLHCPSGVTATLSIVNTEGALAIGGTASAPAPWAGGAVAARIVDRRALEPGSREERVVLPPHVAWVRGSQLVCGYRLSTAAYRVDAEITTRCPTSGPCRVAGDGRAPDNFRFDHAR